MIRFSYYENEKNKRIKQIAFVESETYIGIGTFATIVAIFSAAIYFAKISEKALLYYTIPSLIIVVTMIAVSLSKYLIIKKKIESDYQNADNGVLDYNLYCEGFVYTLKCLQNEKTFKFMKEDVRYSRIRKSTIIVKFKSGVVVDFPKEQSIISLFDV